MVFSAARYLSSHGWDGPGTGFTNKGRRKPIALPHKKNRLGIGSDRETSNNWWDNLFTQVANKLDQPKQPQQPPQQQQRSELYRHFQRGSTIPGTNTSSISCNQPSTGTVQEEEDPVDKKKTSDQEQEDNPDKTCTLPTDKRKKKRHSPPIHNQNFQEAPEEEEAAKKKKKKRRTSHASPPVDNQNFQEIPEEAHKKKKKKITTQ